MGVNQMKNMLFKQKEGKRNVMNSDRHIQIILYPQDNHIVLQVLNAQFEISEYPLNNECPISTFL